MINKSKEPNEFLKLVGANITKYRKKKKLSFEKLAAEIGLNSGHIYRMEKGQNITLLTLFKLALALEITPEKFLKVKYPFHKEELAGLIKDKKSSKK